MTHAEQSITQTKEKSVTQKAKSWNSRLDQNTVDITERDKKEKTVVNNSTGRDTNPGTQISNHLYSQGD